MVKRKYREVKMNRGAEELEAEGTAPESGRELGVSEHTIYGWKAKYWGM